MKTLITALVLVAATAASAQNIGDYRVQYWTSLTPLTIATVNISPLATPAIRYHSGTLGGESFTELGDSLSLVSGKLEANYANIIGKPASPSGGMQTRSFNSAFQPSTTRAVMVMYTVSISATLSLSGGQTGTAFLEISPDNVNWVEIGRLSNGNTGTLTIELGITQVVAGQLAGFVPESYYVRIRTTSTGSPTITYVQGQEVLL